jgi:catechol 2,3-dioxygenase
MRTQIKGETLPGLTIHRVALAVNDLARVADYYQQAIGLHRLGYDGSVMTLGVEGHVLLELREDRHARRRSPREAGLFHTAFLLPDRTHLARWLQFAAEGSIQLAGLADHDVSEAIYLSDPEGNGIEIYADKPADQWSWRDGHVRMVTDPLDVDDLLKHAGDQQWAGIPAGSTVGHVHLQVGDLASAKVFYRDLLGLDVTCHYPGAVFYAADGYHHHLATNIWNSAGAGMRTWPSTGLAGVHIHLNTARLQALKDRMGDDASPQAVVTLQDPWGTPIQVKANE